MNFPIIDSHLHLWDTRNVSYPWLEEYPLLNKPYLLSELMDATKALHLESFVFVQACNDISQAIVEVNWASALAKRDARLRGIIAYAPLEQGEEIYSHLTALKIYPLVRGVRRSLQDEASDFCLQEKFIAAVKLLPEFNFNLDISVRPHQLPAVTELVAQCPQVNFILDHLGRPLVAAKELQPWQDN